MTRSPAAALIVAGVVVLVVFLVFVLVLLVLLSVQARDNIVMLITAVRGDPATLRSLVAALLAGRVEPTRPPASGRGGRKAAP